jgi:hypothetical protein
MNASQKSFITRLLSGLTANYNPGQFDNFASETLFQVRGDEEFPGTGVILDAQNIRLATDLAIFHVALTAASGFIHRGHIPFATRSALKSRLHEKRE